MVNYFDRNRTVPWVKIWGNSLKKIKAITGERVLVSLWIFLSMPPGIIDFYFLFSLQYSPAIYLFFKRKQVSSLNRYSPFIIIARRVLPSITLKIGKVNTLSPHSLNHECLNSLDLETMTINVYDVEHPPFLMFL